MPSLHVPNTHSSVPGTRNGTAPIRRQQRTVGALCVSLEHLKAFSRLEIPYPHAAIAPIAAGGDGAPSVGAELERAHEPGMAFQNTEALSRRHIPQPRRVVPRAGKD